MRLRLVEQTSPCEAIEFDHINLGDTPRPVEGLT